MKAGHPNSANESTAEQDPGEAASLLRAVFKQGLESLLRSCRTDPSHGEG